MIIGPNVTEAYNDFLDFAGIEVGGGTVADDAQTAKDLAEGIKSGNTAMGLIEKFGNVSAQVFMPIVPALIVGGLILSIKNLLVNYCGLSTDSGTAQVLLAIFSASFSFLPVYLGYQLAAVMKMQPVMGALLGAIMISSSISGAEGLDFLGIPIPTNDYSSTVVPIVLGVVFMYFVDRGLQKIIPDITKLFLKPLLTMFIVVPVELIILGPAGSMLLEKTTGARFWDYSHLPFNLHGRICLYWACAFGLGALCICRLVEPALLGLLGHLPVLIVRLSAFIVAVAMMVDALCSLASWRRLSDQLERVRADLADRINESLADASDSMLERIPDSTIDSVAQTHIRSRAVNAWLAELGDAALDALREKASMPTFISDGARGLALAARRVADAAPSMPRPSLSRRLAGKGISRPVPSVSLSRRDLRFFNAFPRLRINRYEGVIRATDLRDRARELFRR